MACVSNGLIDLVDTGANKYLTIYKEDFVEMSNKSCSISGTAGKESGKVGRLKDNVFGLKYGVLFNLPKPIGRIIPYLGNGNLRQTGWDLNMSSTSGLLFHRESGTECAVKYDSNIELPVLDSNLFDSKVCFSNAETRNIHMNIKNTPSEEESCLEVNRDGNSYLSKMELHRRMGHWNIDGLCPVNCRACILSKGQRAPHDKVRKELQVYKPLQTLALDFAGPISPESIRHSNYCLVVICDCVKKVFVSPLRYKHQVSETIKGIVEKIRQDYSVSLDEKVVYFLRRDNEPVLDSTDMTNTLRSLRVCDAPGVPYNPEQNGTAERFIRSLFGSVRAILVDCDQRLWCYACQYSADCWDRIPHKYSKVPEYNGKTPIEICEERSGRNSSKQSAGMLRRFGCLVYFKEQIKAKEKKLDPRWRRGVHLGLCPASSGWLVGTYAKDDRCADQVRWTEYSTRDVKLHEEILIGDLNWLLPSSEGVFIKCDYLNDLQDGALALEYSPLEQSNTLARRQSSSGPGHGLSREAGNKELKVIYNDDVVEPSLTRSPRLEEGNGNLKPRGTTVETEVDKPSVCAEPAPAEPKSRKRGRPAGSKDINKRTRRTKAQMEELKNICHLSNAIGGCELDSGEELVEAHIMLSVTQALNSPDAEKWKEVIDLEEARLLAYETWAPATDEELARAKQALPIAILLTVKRCGKLKARACVLGNLDRTGELNTFAPVVSHTANRLLLITAAAEGDYVIPYDLDSAFLNAPLERDVYCRLPKIWAEKHQTEIVRLRKALYGLKDAPRAWFNLFSSKLSKLGWTPCAESPGLWKKQSKRRKEKWMKLSVYVDDNLLTGPCIEELETELENIFKEAPGRKIDMKETWNGHGQLVQTVDFLGSDVHYCREGRSVRVSMETYIDKMSKKFDVKLGKPVHSPNYSESVFEDEKAQKVPNYPIRSVVGALQWVATVARPDVSVPVSTLAKYVSSTPNMPVVRACRKVIKYLITTKYEGICYSPESELEFNNIYKELLPDGRDVPVLNLFSDAGFANCLKTLRSTSGSIMYFKGTPVCWRSSKQAVRSYSTAESEYIAASDTIVLSETNDFMSFFEMIPKRVVEANYGISPSLDDAVLWVDNESAIITAKSEDTKPRSRHYALRYLRVRDAASKIMFCPTTLQKADGLSKLECSVSQRRLLLHHCADPIINYDCDSTSDIEDDDIDSKVALAKFEYSVYFGF